VISPEECALILTAIGTESKEGNKKLVEIVMQILEKTMEIKDPKVKTKAKNCLIEIFKTSRKASEIPKISEDLINLIGADNIKKGILDIVKEEVSFRFSNIANTEKTTAPTDPVGWKETDDMVSGRLDMEYEIVMESHLKQEAAQFFNIPLTPTGEAIDQYKLKNGRLELERDVPLLKVFYKLYGPHAPARGYKGDAGVDLRLQESVTLQPNERKMVDLGISIAIPGQAVGILTTKSSAGKIGLACHLGVIDANYTGRIKVILQNLSQEPLALEEGKSYLQILLLKNYAPGELIKVNEINLLSERGSQGFGSSNTNKVELVQHSPDLLDLMNITIGAGRANEKRIPLIDETTSNRQTPRTCQEQAEAGLFHLMADLQARDQWGLIDVYLSSQSEKIAQLNCELLSENQLSTDSLARLQYDDEFFGPIIEQMKRNRIFGSYKLRGSLLCTDKNGHTKLCIPSLIQPNIVNHIHKKLDTAGPWGP